MKEKFEDVKVEVIEFSVDDIVTTSDCMADCNDLSNWTPIG